VSLGKYGSFSSNLILERPYNLTYELLDKVDGETYSRLRIVPASELHADVIAEENAANGTAPADDKVTIGGDGVEFELVGENGEVIMRSNRETIDDSARQTLTMEEIEELKREGSNAGQDLIAKLMLSHTALDQKTSFSLAKYKLLKTKKYLRRFTVLPLDVPLLTHWLIEEKDPGKIMEMREEMVALAGCWGNVHWAGEQSFGSGSDELGPVGGGRWLIVDEVAGLLVAAMAERMGILHKDSEDSDQQVIQEEAVKAAPAKNPEQSSTEPSYPPDDERTAYATSNTLTLIHPNAQPNLSLLKYFSFDPSLPNPHPLQTHLKTLSWLQLVSPHLDTTYSTAPPVVTSEMLSSWKSGKRGTYYRKLRRWRKTRSVVDETRAGNFDGLVIAATMDPVSILHHLVPLLRGAAPVVIYSPTIEPLTHIADLYSTSRRTAFITSPPEVMPCEDFPLNPTLLLGVTVQTSKVRDWQVLPGRTHPLMTSRGGAEGYLLTATRVLPADGKVEARGKYKRGKGTAKEEEEGNKRRKVEAENGTKVKAAEVTSET
jgi:tRNA (adenine-N(1)-)-methyltransferase non-catalytic subunit